MTEKKEKNFKTSIGGQALLEGIMMRGPKKQAIVVRTEDGLVDKVDDIKMVKDNFPILGLPFIRGTVNYIATMVEGIKALTYSASFLPEEEQENPSKLDLWIEKHFSGKTAENLIIALGVVLGLGVSVVLFFLLPTALTGLLNGVIEGRIVKNLIEGLIRICIFILYLWLTSKVKDIKRVWQYHGAEHKTIFCYEAGLELTVENARKQSRFHPRCGTSFLFIIIIVSILVFTVVSWSNVLLRMVFRLLLLPVVVGISYELIKLAGRYDNAFTRLISAPGKAMQRLTTKEPDDEMLEVAIAALKLVLPENEGEDAW